MPTFSELPFKIRSAGTDLHRVIWFFRIDDGRVGDVRWSAWHWGVSCYNGVLTPQEDSALRRAAANEKNLDRVTVTQLNEFDALESLAPSPAFFDASARQYLYLSHFVGAVVPIMPAHVLSRLISNLSCFVTDKKSAEVAPKDCFHHAKTAAPEVKQACLNARNRVIELMRSGKVGSELHCALVELEKNANLYLTGFRAEC